MRFPDDYGCESLRGHKLPGPGRVRKVLMARCAWLIQKVEAIPGRGGIKEFFLDELAATAVALEAYEAQQNGAA